MRLLDRYLLRELLIPLAYCLAGFLIFWIAFDLISEVDEFQEQGLTLVGIIQYYLIKIPEFMATVMPVGLLLAALYALTNHSRYHEITAVRSAGISLWRISWPYLGVGFVLSLILFYLNEVLVPDSHAAVQKLLRQQSDERPSEIWIDHLHFRNDREGRIWLIERFNPQTSELINPQVEWVGPEGSPRHLFARRGIRTNGVWRFFDVQQIVYWPEGQTNRTDNRGKRDFNYVSIPTNVLDQPEFSETPAQIQSEIKISQLSSIKAAKKVRLSIREILNYFRLHPELNPGDEAMLKTQLHARLASPWTCLVVVLIALPFGASSGRRNTFVSVASSIFIGFGYFILFKLGLALGTGGFIPPWVAAWIPNLMFTVLGIVLLSRSG